MQIKPQREDGREGNWRWGLDTAILNIDSLIPKFMPSRKVWGVMEKDYLEGRALLKPTSAWTFKDVNSERGSEEFIHLGFDKRVFQKPKPIGTLCHLFDLSLGKGSRETVLDFFSGSATIAHALFKYNSEKNAQNRVIMVQLPEKCDEKSEAYKSGYRTICDLGKERIHRAGENIKQETSDTNIDIGFKVFRVADTNIKWNSLMDAGQLDLTQVESTPDLVDFMPNSNDIDIVYELMLRQRDVPLSETLEQLSDIGNRTYLYASSYLVCLESEITVGLINKLAELDPLPIKFIFRDSAFKDDIALKDETFRRLKALIEKNAGNSKVTYTVEFI